MAREIRVPMLQRGLEVSTGSIDPWLGITSGADGGAKVKPTFEGLPEANAVLLPQGGRAESNLLQAVEAEPQGGPARLAEKATPQSQPPAADVAAASMPEVFPAPEAVPVAEVLALARAAADPAPAGLFTGLLATPTGQPETGRVPDHSATSASGGPVMGCNCPACCGTPTTGDGTGNPEPAAKALSPDGDVDWTLPQYTSVPDLTADGELEPLNGNSEPWEYTPLSGNATIDGVLWRTNWSDNAISYSDPDSTADYQTGYFATAGQPNYSTGFSQLTANQLVAAHTILNQSLYTQLPGSTGLSVEAFTGLSVTYLADTGASTIRLANTSSGVVGTARVADFPGGNMHAGDVWFGGSGDNPTTGNYDYATTIHELGHALGLKHGHQATNELGTGAPVLPTATDSMEYSIMTYRSYVGGPITGYTNETWGFAQTWMMYDIQALQYIYGADYTANSGNTVYSWSPTSGNTLINGNIALQPGGNKIFATIWDGGGVDTYDLSAYVTGVDLNLTPGSHSVFSFAQLADLDSTTAGREARGNIFNALLFGGNQASMIENANGGSGADTIYGNKISNVLRGNAGNDTMRGSEWGEQAVDAADTMYGGNGNDYMGGHAGNDLMYGDADNDTVIGDAGNDYIYGGTGNDYLVGDYTDASGNGNDWLYGDTGYDTLYGGTGNDTLYGGTEDDRLYGQDGTDYLSGQDGNDRLYGGNQNDTLYGGAGNDSLYGEAGVAAVYGDDGNDYIVDGNSGTGDSFDGGLGTDTLVADFTWVDAVLYDLASGWMRYPGSGGTTHDTILNIENLTTAGGADVIGTTGANVITILDTGFVHDNTITAGSGDDTVSAGIGNDSVEGGGGYDLIYGGAGNDTLLGGFTTDTIYGGDGNDLIRVLGGEYYDNVDGGLGSDTLDHSASTYTGTTFDFEAGTITGTWINGVSAFLLGIETYHDGSGGNTIVSDGSGHAYYGNGGDDTMIAEVGAETMDGGAGGTDTLDLTRWSGAYVVDMTTGASNYGGELYTNFENLISGAGNDSITGTSGDNVITTNGGNDSINAGAGMDTVNAGDGDDIITDTQGMGASDDDVYDGGAGTDTLVHDLGWGSVISFDLDAGWSSYFGNRDQIISIENLTVGGAASVTGSAVANVLTVNGIGANVINGLAGNDTINAGGGNDSINAGNGMDVVNAGDGDDIITDTEAMTASDSDVYDGGAGNDTLVHDDGWHSGVAFNLDTGWATVSGSNRDQLISIENLTVGGNASVTGSAVANVLTVNGIGANVINGLGGNDTINAGGGDDTVDGGSGSDTVSGGTGNDSLLGGNDDDQLNGDEGVDTLLGGTGNDLLWGASSAVVGDGGDLIYGEAGNDTVGGSYGNDWIDGGADDDALYGDEGNDTLLGGAGNDYIRGDWAGGLDPTGADSIDGGEGNDTLLGGAGNDTVAGGEGSDTLDGGAGDDSMLGGLGDDLYRVDSAADVLVEKFGQGLDAVESTLLDFTLPKNVENLALVGAGNQNGTGNWLANLIVGQAGNNVLDGLSGLDTLVGGDGDDTLNGGPGADSLLGGAGNDVLNGGGSATDVMVGGTGDDDYAVDWSSDSVVELAGEGIDSVRSTSLFYVLPAHVENLFNRLTSGVQNGTGNELDNVMTGVGADDNLVGLDGNDSISGLSGNDTLRGGNGNDTLNGGADNDTLFGAAGDDSLLGGGGNDTLNGGAGNDTMAGGAGDDDYVFVSTGDVLTESLNAGYDRVFSSSSFTLGNHFEYLELNGGGNVGTGNGLDNTLVGNSNANTLSGLGGADTLDGRLGNDSLYGGVDAAEDRFVFSTALNAATNVDTLFEAEFPEDQILLANDVFSMLQNGSGGNTGTLGAGFYFEGSGFLGNGAADAVGIWYDLATGGLYYNPTSGTAGDSSLFAFVDGASALLDSVDFTLFDSPLAGANIDDAAAGFDGDTTLAGLVEMTPQGAESGYSVM